MKDKSLTESQLLGPRGIALISEKIGKMGLVWRETSEHDVGIDGEIEIRDSRTGIMSGLLIKVQSKAVSQFKNETNDSFDFASNEKDIKYWLSVNLPVILIVSKPDTQEAYWLSVKDYISAHPDTKTFRFSKVKNELTPDSLGALIGLCKHTSPSKFLPPMAKHEYLTSNLLPLIDLAPHLYIGSTDYRERKQLFADVKTLGLEIEGDFILRNGQILSFHNLAEPPYRRLCDQGTVEEFSSNEWAFSLDKERRYEFVQLLNTCLREKLHPLGIIFDYKSSCYFFKPSDNRQPYKYAYRSQHNNTDREVFKAYKKNKQGRVICWRHSAMKAQFYRFENKWVLEVTPTYFFTFDGYRMHLQHPEWLKEMKEMEKNNAVRGQFLMWASVLHTGGDMYRTEYPFFRFGDLIEFKLNVGIEDEQWKGKDATINSSDLSNTLFELS